MKKKFREIAADEGVSGNRATESVTSAIKRLQNLLTIRPIKENGDWGAKCRKVYDLNGRVQRIPDGKGGWKSHRGDTTDWNQRDNAEKWRAARAAYTNRVLEATDRPERIDHRSYKRQGVDKIPSVHMGPAASQMERRGIVTEKGNINRKTAADNKRFALP